MELFADHVPSLGESAGALSVALSNELVTLLSEQLYQSPVKAIEELVVNSYDAEAKECRIYAPAPSESADGFIVIFDDGMGMSYEGLVNLWHIGRSNKRDSEIEKRSTRKQIGRFGIGKLATYTIANKLTYLTKREGKILIVTLDFRRFKADASGATKAVELGVRQVSDWKALAADPRFRAICKEAAVDITKLESGTKTTWTMAVLEELKPKAAKLTLGRLRWVLGTAMPLKTGFKLFLNGDEVHSSKSDFEKLVEFTLGEIPEKRLKSLSEATGETWRVVGSRLECSLFPSGISGSIIVTRQSLLGKSDDLGRSHGFFVRVRERLINEDQPHFGVEAKSYQTFYRFRADIAADDLDSLITAPRESIEESRTKEVFKLMLQSVFNEARVRFELVNDEREKAEKNKKEDQRNFINPRLVEHPIADILTDPFMSKGGGEADGTWFYLDVPPGTDASVLAKQLYDEKIPRAKYRYESTNRGRNSRMVSFNPVASTFSINEDHDLVRAHSDGLSRELLEDLVTAEALLEVYLRECRVPPEVIGEILEKRDSLWRSLAKDHPYSLEAMSAALRDAASDEHDLELALVASSRALGFVAKHISGEGEPDGLARFVDYPDGERVITLEAKSSISVPSLAAIDFAGLREHIIRHDAHGCLLIAPSYPGKSREEDSAAATRARDLKISCWTVEQLARVVASAEARHITARQILDIVLNQFSPDQVTAAIEKLFAEPTWEIRSLYSAVLDALRGLESRLPDANRTVDLVAAEISRMHDFADIKKEAVTEAVRQLAFASQGGLTLKDERIILHLSYDELSRRLTQLTKNPGPALRQSNFRSLPLPPPTGST